MRFISARMEADAFGFRGAENSSGYMWIVVDTSGFSIGIVWAVCSSENSAQDIADALNAANP